jgi:hypothetical protein
MTKASLKIAKAVNKLTTKKVVNKVSKPATALKASKTSAICKAPKTLCTAVAWGIATLNKQGRYEVQEVNTSRSMARVSKRFGGYDATAKLVRIEGVAVAYNK